MKLIIFDLDQTLVQLFPLHNKTSGIVMKKVFEVKARMQEIDYAGKTLKKTIYELAMLKGISKNEREKKIAKAVKLYVKEFISMLPKNKKKFYLPGAINLIKKLSQNKDNFLIILSGDAERIVRTALKRANMLKHFKFIVTGEHEISRIKLIRKAVKKAHKKARINKFNKVIVIGDSTHDIASGKAINALTIAVTTGTHTKQQLKKAGADYIFRNLKNKKILEIIEKE